MDFGAFPIDFPTQPRLRTAPGLKSGIHTCWPNCLSIGGFGGSNPPHFMGHFTGQRISGLANRFLLGYPNCSNCCQIKSSNGLGLGHFIYGSVVTPITAPHSFSNRKALHGNMPVSFKSNARGRPARAGTTSIFTF